MKLICVCTPKCVVDLFSSASGEHRCTKLQYMFNECSSIQDRYVTGSNIGKCFVFENCMFSMDCAALQVYCCCLGFDIMEASTVIAGSVPTCNSHLYSAAPLGGHQGHIQGKPQSQLRDIIFANLRSTSVSELTRRRPTFGITSKNDKYCL